MAKARTSAASPRTRAAKPAKAVKLSTTARPAKASKRPPSVRPAKPTRSKHAPGMTKVTKTARGQVMAERKDKGAPGEVAIERMPEPQRSIARALDRMIRATVPACTSVVKWGNACYFSGGRAFAAMMETSKGINLAVAGVGVDDPAGLLEGTGKTMRHVKVKDVAMAEGAELPALVRQAEKIGLKGM